jgi:hypothetical protein
MPAVAPVSETSPSGAIRQKQIRQAFLRVLFFGSFIGEGPMSEFITDEQRRAYQRGYSDYERTEGGSKSLSILHPAYDPPPGCEAAYRAGWNEAEKGRRREWSGDA